MLSVRRASRRASRSRAAALVPAALAAGLLAACTSTVEGSASPASTSAAPTASASAPTSGSAPAAEVTPAPEVGPGTGAEARRIAAVTALAVTTTPERTDSCFPAGPFGSASGVDGLYFGDGRVEQELDRWGFVAGWGTCAQDAAGNSTLVLVGEMSDPDSAVAAATALNEISTDLGGADYSALELPDLGVTGALSTGGSDSAGAAVDTVQVWVPSGRMLAYTYLDAPAGTSPPPTTTPR